MLRLFHDANFFVLNLLVGLASDKQAIGKKSHSNKTTFLGLENGCTDYLFTLFCFHVRIFFFSFSYLGGDLLIEVLCFQKLKRGGQSGIEFF